MGPDIDSIQLTLGVLGGATLGGFTTLVVSFLRMLLDLDKWSGRRARYLVLAVASILSALAIGQLYRDQPALDWETFVYDLIPAWIAVTISTAVFAFGWYDGLIKPVSEARAVAGVQERVAAAITRSNAINSQSRTSVAPDGYAEAERGTLPNESPSDSLRN